MRSEQEMMDLILGVAKADGRIRAAYLNGSRANPRVAKDPYRDYDVVYVVEETASFLADKGWISVFGEPGYRPGTRIPTIWAGESATISAAPIPG